MGVLLRILLGEDPAKSEMVQKGADLCIKVIPIWDEKAGTIDMVYHLFGFLAMYQVGGETWERWNAACRDFLVDAQKPDGAWDPVGVWGRDGGRIYSTAMMVLSLETYYRYPKVFDRKRERRHKPSRRLR
jgi:hypothetical protein